MACYDFEGLVYMHIFIKSPFLELFFFSLIICEIGLYVRYMALFYRGYLTNAFHMRYGQKMPPI